MMPAITKSDNRPLPVTPTTSDCCRTTEDGAALCAVPENGKPSACECYGSNQKAKETSSTSGKLNQQTSGSSKIRSGALFVVACLASPCCTPLYVPLLLVLLAGTPSAVWLSAHVGWLYAALTLISMISFVLAIRWWPKLTGRQKPQTAVSTETQALPKTTFSLEEAS